MLKEEDKNTSDFQGDVEQDKENMDSKCNDDLENDKDMGLETEEDKTEAAEENEVSDINPEEELKNENIKLKSENEKIHNEFKTLQDRLSRTAAEYDNFRKRTAKEKEAIYSDACRDILKEIVPVLDNLERAVEVEGDIDDLRKGVEMTIRQFKTAFEKLNVEEISAEGEFDPNIHNAVMHIEDDNYDKNSIVEVFQKGYKREDKVIRYSMVKVAN